MGKFDISNIKRIILSRKGFDTSFGDLPNAIMENGDLVVFPIPGTSNQHQDDKVKYSELKYDGKTYYEIMKDLNENIFDSEKNTIEYCHFDPDIEENIKEERNYSWKGSFGQSKQALSHLKNKGVDGNDLFLFFGRFRNVIFENGKYKYKPDTKPIHMIYGYLLIERLIDKFDEMAKELPWHPHSCELRKVDTENGKNGIFIAKKINDVFCCGYFKYNKNLVLTKDNMNITKWDFKPWYSKLSYHSSKCNHEDEGYFQSVSRGQEFVLEVNGDKDIKDFLNDIFNTSNKKEE